MSRLYRRMHSNSRGFVNLGFEATTNLRERDSVLGIKVASGGGVLSVDGSEVAF